MNLELPPGGILVGLGADVIEVERIRGVLERQGERFLARVFTRGGAGILLPDVPAAQAPRRAVRRQGGRVQGFTTGIGARTRLAVGLRLPRRPGTSPSSGWTRRAGAAQGRRRDPCHPHALPHGHGRHGRRRARPGLNAGATPWTRKPRRSRAGKALADPVMGDARLRPGSALGPRAAQACARRSADLPRWQEAKPAGPAGRGRRG